MSYRAPPMPYSNQSRLCVQIIGWASITCSTLHLVIPSYSLFLVMHSLPFHKPWPRSAPRQDDCLPHPSIPQILLPPHLIDCTKWSTMVERFFCREWEGTILCVCVCEHVRFVLCRCRMCKGSRSLGERSVMSAIVVLILLTCLLAFIYKMRISSYLAIVSY